MYFPVKTRLIHIIYIALLSMMVVSCSVDKYIPEGEHMLTGVAVTCDDEEVKKTYMLGDYVVQQTNSKWFGARVPLKIYMLSGTDTTKRSCRFWRKLGEAPVLYDSVKAQRTMDDIEKVLNNAGYMKAEVEEFKMIKGKKMKVLYNVHPKERYTMRKIQRIVEDKGLEHFIEVEDTANSLLKPGLPFEVTALNGERNRIAAYLRNNGYYKFTKEDIRFSADTAKYSSEVDVLMRVKRQQDNGRTEATEHKQYTIGKVRFLADITTPTSQRTACITRAMTSCTKTNCTSANVCSSVTHWSSPESSTMITISVAPTRTTRDSALFHSPIST